MKADGAKLLMKMLTILKKPDISRRLEDTGTNVYKTMVNIGKPLESLIFQGFFVFYGVFRRG